jgi:outer membrane protein insertion porin family
MRDCGGAMCGRKAGAGLFARAVAIVLFAMMTMVSTAFTSPAQAQTYQFSRLQVEGNERIETATIASLAGIGQGQPVTAGQLNAATQRILNSGLFRSVDVVPQGGTLLIRVQEWPTISVINFEGNRRLDDDRLASVIQSQARRVYSPSVAEADAAAIVELYRDAGRLAAEVEARIIERSGNRVDLVFEVREGRIVEIERLSFVGNRAYSDARLRRVLETKQAGLLRTLIQSDTFVEERIEFDRQLLRDFYLARGYVDFEVLSVTSELAQERDGVFITFTIREGQSFRFGDISFVSEIEGVDPAPFDRQLRVRSGSTFTPTVLEANIARLEKIATDQGLSFARVEPRVSRNDAALTLDVEFALVRGPRVFVERIDIEGNTTTRDEVIRRQFRIAEGDPFNPREIREAAERIRALGYFAEANVDTSQGSAGDQVVVDVDLEETTTGSLGFGISYSVDSGAGFALTFRETNFLGRGQTLDFALSTGTSNQDTSIRFIEPAFLGRDLTFGLEAYYRTTETFNAAYNTRNIGFSPSLGFPISEYGRFDVRFSASKDSILNVPVGSSPVVANDAGGVVTSALGYTFTYDTRGSQVSPDFGYVFRLNQDFAGLGGDRRFVKTTALAGVEQRVFNQEVTLRAQLEAGAILAPTGGQTRINERFFLNDEMRGFAFNGLGPRDTGAPNQDALGGNYFAVARFEADFPLGLPEEYGITGGLFMDVGSVWNVGPAGGAAVTLSGDNQSWRAAAGFSLFWETPIGPLRFNFSRPLRKEAFDKQQNFDLTVSTRF